MSSKTIENGADCNGPDERRLVMWKVASEDDFGILLFDLDVADPGGMPNRSSYSHAVACVFRNLVDERVYRDTNSGVLPPDYLGLRLYIKRRRDVTRPFSLLNNSMWPLDPDASFRLDQYEEATLAMFNHALLRMNER